MSSDPHPVLSPVSQGDASEHGAPDDAPPPLPSVPFEEAVRIVEAMLFASDGPLTAKFLADHVGDTASSVIDHLKERYATSGVTLVEVAGGFALRTASDLAYLFE